MQFYQITLPYDANVVEGICKDSQGMIWFATRRGVFAYDGASDKPCGGGCISTNLKNCCQTEHDCQKVITFAP